MFLPPLVFEAAKDADPHVFQKSITQTIILAGPGVLISTGLTAVVAIYTFDSPAFNTEHVYGWNWDEALLFGSMMSATDPVAVVSLLGELGAPASLSTIIEGESLLNE
jgi:NhaP-type Na+/H+ or K+/H+ antiporter